MWPSDVRVVVQQIRPLLTQINQLAKEQDGDAIEETAKEIARLAGRLIVAMRTEGIWAGLRIGDGKYMSGDFGNHSQ